MNKADLIAPETYNIVSEIEKYANDPSKKRLFLMIKLVKNEI